MINMRIKTLTYTGKENGFILDCTNKEKSELKDYISLYDIHLVNYFKNETIRKQLKQKGVISKKRYIMFNEYYKTTMKHDSRIQSPNKMDNKIKYIHLIKKINDITKSPKKDLKTFRLPTTIKFPIETNYLINFYSKNSSPRLLRPINKSKTVNKKIFLV